MIRVSDSKYLMAYLLPACMLVGLWMGSYLAWLPVVMGFVLIPLVELLLPFRVDTGPREERIHPIFDYLLYLNVLWVYGLTAFFLFKVSHSESLMEQIGFTWSMGLVLGTNAINVAHELGHRTTWFETFLARLLLVPCLFTYFTIEHNRGHHKHVGTPVDPATASMGQSIYRYWLRALPGVFMNAWNLERERLHRSGLPTWSPGNAMISGLLSHVVYLAIVFSVFGSIALWCAIGAALYSILLLEAINYVEHYGLTRAMLPNGHYERVQPKHSWNSDRTLGRIMLFELSRHSDHHHRSARPYQNLQAHIDAPELPTGYPGSLLLTLIPSIWFRVIDRRIPT